ncbi:MAG: EpsG family protein [Clostridia bacterium]|nr:EpsG family protein [Clostridia bacterium]
MLIYYLLFVLLLGSYVLLFKSGITNEKKARIAYTVIFFLAVGLLLALRHPSMGVDLKYYDGGGYWHAYIKIAGWSWEDVFTRDLYNYERGYIIFNKILSIFSKDPQTLLVACGLITALPTAIIIYRDSKNTLLSSVIYLGLTSFFIAFSGMRQAVAIAITMLAYLMIKDKRWVAFVLLVLLAYTFHSSAIVFLVAYPLYHLRHTDAFKIGSFVAIPFVYIFRVPLFTVLSTFFKDNAEIEDTGALTLFLVFVVLYLFLLVFSDKENKLSCGTTNIFWVACICQAFGGVYNTAMRVGYYFMVYAMIAIPEVIDTNGYRRISLDDRYKRLIKVVVFIAFVAFALYTFAKGGEESWYMTNPYSFFWQK